MMTGVTGQGDMSAKQSLYEVVARWNVETGDGLADLIHAACVALSDGLDSPALRDLAAASAEDSSWAIRRLVGQALEELDIPQPGTVAPGGGTAGGPGVDSLRLEVARVRGEHAGGGFQVLVYVNDVEMTAAAAGLGMDPYDVLVPTNRLVATAEPHTVPIARCGCGVYGCGSTDVTIVRAGDLVHWDWLIEVPMHRGVSFSATRYDDELARVAADHSWETPERTAGRHVLTDLDRNRLRTYGLSPSWVGSDYRDPTLFRVALQLDSDYQVFVDTPWRGRDPETLARDVCQDLTRPPQQWHASWHAIKPTLTTPPTIAGPSWHHMRF